MRGYRLIEARRARWLRNNSTQAEALLWAKLRNRQLGGYKFARQASLGPYFVDFVCRERKFIIELDGATHSKDDELARDRTRTTYLESQDYRVSRFANAEVYGNLDGVLETILIELTKRHGLRELTQPLTPALSPQAGRGSSGNAS
jgi:very-short-patch-repair endonuclease